MEITNEIAGRLDSIAKMYVGTVVRIKPGFSNFITNEICYLSSASVKIADRYIGRYDRNNGYVESFDGTYYKFEFSIKSNINAHTRTFSFFFKNQKSLEMYLATTFESPNNFTHANIIFLKECKLSTSFTRTKKEKVFSKGDILEIVGIFNERKEVWRWHDCKMTKRYFNDYCNGNMLNEFEYVQTFYLKDKKENIYTISFKNDDSSEEYFELFNKE